MRIVTDEIDRQLAANDELFQEGPVGQPPGFRVGAPRGDRVAGRAVQSADTAGAARAVEVGVVPLWSRSRRAARVGNGASMFAPSAASLVNAVTGATERSPGKPSSRTRRATSSYCGDPFAHATRPAPVDCPGVLGTRTVAHESAAGWCAPHSVPCRASATGRSRRHPQSTTAPQCVSHTCLGIFRSGEADSRRR